MTEPLKLWPGSPPGSTEHPTLEVDRAGTFLGQPEPHIVRNVSVPTLTPYLPDNGNGTAVIVAPGGGFRFLSMDNEGTTVAELLRKNGIAAFLLKYRLLYTGETDEEFNAGMMQWFLDQMVDGRVRPVKVNRIATETEALAYADGRQAVRLLRERAADFAVDPRRIGFLGFSAGAFVATSTALSEDPQERPDFVAPIYGGGVPDTVPSDAPPWFCAVSADDDLCLQTCLDSFTAWRAAGRPAELHVYEQGGHGFGTQPKGLPSDGWFDRYLDWLRSRQLLT